MALELRQPRRFGFLDEDLVEICIAQRERNVHQRTVILRHRRVIELGLVEIIVKQSGLGAVDLLHRGHTALLFQPLEHQPCDINAVGRRRVRHRIVFRLHLVVKYGGRDRQGLAQQIIAHDDDGHAGRSDILLRAGVNQAVTRHIHRPRQDVRRHVGDDRHAAGVRYPMKLDAANGLVGCQMHIRSIGIELPFRLFRCPRVVVSFGTRGNIDLAVFLGVGDGLLRPLSGVDVIGIGLAAQQVHRHHGELRRCAALQEQHFVVFRNSHQFAQVGFGLGVNGDEFLAAMAHFHHRHAAAVPIEHFRSGLLQHRFRQHRRTRAEIDYSCHQLSSA